jgi:hypothetical protein
MITECRSPITAISMIITMVGTAATPLITALENSGLQAAGGLCSALTRWRSSTCPWHRAGWPGHAAKTQAILTTCSNLGKPD